MKTKQKLAAVATGAFILSFFLPVDRNGGTGFGCFCYCLSSMLGQFLAPKPRVYFSGFVVANLLFPILAFMMMFSARCFSRTRRWLALLISLQVLSWFLLAVISPGIISGNELSSIRLGYYVWLGAYVLLFFVHVLNRNEINQTTGQL